MPPKRGGGAGKQRARNSAHRGGQPVATSSSSIDEKNAKQKKKSDEKKARYEKSKQFRQEFARESAKFNNLLAVQSTTNLTQLAKEEVNLRRQQSTLNTILRSHRNLMSKLSTKIRKAGDRKKKSIKIGSVQGLMSEIAENINILIKDMHSVEEQVQARLKHHMDNNNVLQDFRQKLLSIADATYRQLDTFLGEELSAPALRPYESQGAGGVFMASTLNRQMTMSGRQADLGEVKKSHEQQHRQERETTEDDDNDEKEEKPFVLNDVLAEMINGTTDSELPDRTGWANDGKETIDDRRIAVKERQQHSLPSAGVATDMSSHKYYLLSRLRYLKNSNQRIDQSPLPPMTVQKI